MKHMLVTSSILLVIASFTVAQAPGVMPGQWTLDVARSTYSPGPKPQSQHAVLTALPNGIRTVADRVEADGRKVHFEWNGTYWVRP